MAIKIQTTGYSYGRRGDAVVKKSEKADLLLVKFVEDDMRFKVNYDKNLVPHPEKVSGVFRVSLDENNSFLRYISPVNDIVKGLFIGFTRNDDGQIVVKSVEERSGVKNGRKWTIPEHLEFFARFYLPDLGIVIPHRVPFSFVNVEGEAGIAGFGVGKLREFLTATGVDFANDTLPFDDNLLDVLEKLLLSRKQPVKLSFERGYVDSLTAFQSYSVLEVDETAEESEDEDEEEEVIQPKKAEPAPKKAEPAPKKAETSQKKSVDELLQILGYDPD